MRGELSIIFIAALLLSLSSCGTIDRLALNTISSIIYDATPEIETETNWDNFKQAVPANLKMIEGLLYLNPENSKLLVSLIKGYVAQAFAINETLYLEDYLADKEESDNLKQAIWNYTRALNYGIKFFKDRGIAYKDLTSKSMLKDGIIQLLDNSLGDDVEELEAVLFSAQALSGLINLQKDNMTLVAQLPVAKALYDWVCTRKPKINFGTCDIFYAAYESARPKMLGGNPAKGKQLFLRAISDWPDNWLARVAFIQYYQLPMMDQNGYREQAVFLEKKLEEFEQQQVWRPFFKGPEADQDQDDNRRVRLYQAIALRRFRIIQKFSQNIF